jgi:hypothetical protein
MGVCVTSNNPTSTILVVGSDSSISTFAGTTNVKSCFVSATSIAVCAGTTSLGVVGCYVIDDFLLFKNDLFFFTVLFFKDKQSWRWLMFDYIVSYDIDYSLIFINKHWLLLFYDKLQCSTNVCEWRN